MKNLIKILLKVIVSFGFIYLVFSKLHLENLANEFLNMKLEYFVIATILYLATLLVSTVRWSYFIRQRKSFNELFELYMIGTFFNLFMPGTIGGDAIKAYYLYKGSQKKGDSLVSVFMERFMGFMALMVVALIGFLYGYQYIKGTYVVTLFLSVLGGFTGATLFVLFFPYEMFYHKLKDVRHSIRGYLAHKKTVAHTFALSFIVQVVGVIVVYLLSIGLGMDASIKIFIILIPLITVISMIPISFSGLGLREYSFLYLFGIFGVSKEKAVSLSIIWFLQMMISGLLGMVYYVKKKA